MQRPLGSNPLPPSSSGQHHHQHHQQRPHHLPPVPIPMYIRPSLVVGGGPAAIPHQQARFHTSGTVSTGNISVVSGPSPAPMQHQQQMRPALRAVVTPAVGAVPPQLIMTPMQQQQLQAMIRPRFVMQQQPAGSSAGSSVFPARVIMSGERSFWLPAVPF